MTMRGPEGVLFCERMYFFAAGDRPMTGEAILMMVMMGRGRCGHAGGIDDSRAKQAAGF